MANPGTIRVKEGSSWVDILHPINSWYFSKVSTSPASLFGGTWQQITNAVLRSATGYGYGGSDTMTLTTSQIPAHKHTVRLNWSHGHRALIAQSGGSGGSVGLVVNGGGANWISGYIENGGNTSSPSCANTGGGASFSKLPRYCNLYCWVRTA